MLKLHDSSRLTNFTVLRCNHRIVDVLWITLPSCFSEHNFNTLGIRVVLSLFLLLTLAVQALIVPSRCTRRVTATLDGKNPVMASVTFPVEIFLHEIAPKAEEKEDSRHWKPGRPGKSRHW